ncbi:MAG: ABC transporter permease [Bacteroidota bacterium]
MLTNYIKIAFRNLVRNRVYSFINIFGLTLGIVSVVLIMMFVSHEYSYDKFHENNDRIHKVTLERIYPTYNTFYSIIPHSYAEVIVKDFPEVIGAVRVLGGGNNAIGITVIKDNNEEEVFEESRLIQADSNFFSFFSFKLLKGDPGKVLKKPTDVVLTESTAIKFFGSSDVIGKGLRIGQNEINITGVCEDPPPNSHIQFTMIGCLNGLPFIENINYIAFSTHTYLMLKNGANPKALESKFDGMVETYAAAQIEQSLGTSFEDYVAAGNGYRYYLRPLTSVHLDPENIEGEFVGGGNKTFVFILISIAVLILIIACINFMNLATARATERAREVGVRKTLGSFKSQLIAQFLAESVVISLISMLLGILILQLVLPSFNNLTNLTLTLKLIDITLIAGIVIFAVMVGLLAGIYPAFYLSSFNPAYVLKGSMATSKSGSWLRNALVVFQFTTSIALIGGTITVYKQLLFMQSKDLGFDKEQILVVDNAFALGDKMKTFRDEVQALPGVKSAGVGSTVPGGFFFGFQFQLEGNDEVITTKAMNGNEDLCRVLDLRLKEGRLFSEDFEDSLSIILNEAAIKAYGLEDPVGKKIYGNQTNPPAKIPLTIIGVVEDFHFMSLKDEITPLVLLANESTFGFNFNYAVKLKSEDIPTTIKEIGKKWLMLTENQPYKYDFLDTRLNDQYQAEQASGKLFGVFAVLAIFIACVGLFGLAAYTANQKTKEIGIRKVLGSSVWGVVTLLSKHFTILVVISLVLAVPIIYYSMTNWLSSFAYKTSIGISTFVIAGAAAMLIAWITVSYQSYKAAIVNPVDSLGTE